MKPCRDCGNYFLEEFLDDVLCTNCYLKAAKEWETIVTTEIGHYCPDCKRIHPEYRRCSDFAGHV